MSRVNVKISIFASPTKNFSLGSNIIGYTPSQDTGRKKNFNLVIDKAKMPIQAAIKPIHTHFFLQRPLLYHFLTENGGAEAILSRHQSDKSRADR